MNGGRRDVWKRRSRETEEAHDVTTASVLTQIRTRQPGIQMTSVYKINTHWDQTRLPLCLSVHPHISSGKLLNTFPLHFGGGYYLKSCHSACQKIPRLLMETEGSLSCSQNPTTGPHLEPAESSLPHRSLFP